jgi:ribonuclease BN (tRNA processing enzyme)
VPRPEQGPVLEGLAERLGETAATALVLGAPGTGKSTLCAALGEALWRRGAAPACLGADPGSPAFGVPGALALGRWCDGGWRVERLSALCTLDAGRFRMPLVAAVGRLAEGLEGTPLLVDAPGVVRGVAGAELLTGLVEALAVRVAVVLFRGEVLPLRQELCALGVETIPVAASERARAPSKRARMRRRTRLWDAYLGEAGETRIGLSGLPLLGTPPPLDAPSSWGGRQVAALGEGGRTLTLGEVAACEGSALRVRMAAVEGIASLLVRDAGRGADGLLGTLAPAQPGLRYAPPLDLSPAPDGGTTGPRPVIHMGPAIGTLVNGVLGDPLLHLRLRQRRRSLLFDLGEALRLPARIAHQVTDVFVSHAHFDHIAGFLWLLRSRIGVETVCRLYGPPGLCTHLQGFVQGVLWDRVGGRGPRFEVVELREGGLHRFRLGAGIAAQPLGATACAEPAVLVEEPDFRVSAVTLDHGTPVLAYALEPARKIAVRAERLARSGLRPGPWINELKARLAAGRLEGPLLLPDGERRDARALATELLEVGPGQRLVYATDLADTPRNRERCVALARGASFLVCEAAFCAEHRVQATRTGHLTARACGEIARAAGVGGLVPFHFSRRYEREPWRVYDEVREVFPRVPVPDPDALGGR